MPQKCPGCPARVSDTLLSFNDGNCPYCGYPVESQESVTTLARAGNDDSVPSDAD